MTLPSITREAVLAAMTEFDRLGREAFLAEYRFGPAKLYFVEHHGKLYDSKAIVGYAHGEMPGEPRWTTDDFTGGEASVARHLRDRLGFRMVIRRDLDWTRDEVILACDLVRANGWHGLRATRPEVIELSKILQAYWIHPLEDRADSFRTRNSVQRKTMDPATRHPSYEGVPTRGSKLDRQILDEFIANPEEMHLQAQAIRQQIIDRDATADLVDDLNDPDLDGVSAVEGGVLEQIHLRRERDRGLRDRAVEAHKGRHGSVSCEACGFDFAATYGPRGEDYIECHHKVPLSVSGTTVTRLSDFALLCSNCHRMIHRRRPWLTFDGLVELIRSQDGRWS